MMIPWRQQQLPSFSPEADPLPAALLERTAERLRAIRGTMPDDAFAALVRDVVRFQLRWGEPSRPTRPD
jgi:hypothetical protein